MTISEKAGLTRLTNSLPPGTVTRENSLGRELGEKTRDRVNSVNLVSQKLGEKIKNLDRTQWTRLK